MDNKQKFTVQIIEPQDYPEWDAFVDASGQGTIFSKTKWLKLIAEASGQTYKVIGCYKGTELMGGIALYIKKNKFSDIVTPSPYTPYNTILYLVRKSNKTYKAEKQIHDILSVLCRYLEHSFDFVRLILHPNIPDIRPFQWNLWRSHISYTYQIKLSEDALDRMSLDIKRRAGLAEKNGIYVKTIDDVDSLFRLLDKSYKRQGIRHSLPRENFNQVCRALLESKQAQIKLSLTKDAVPVAANMLIFSNQHVYYWAAGVDENFLETGGNQLLIINTILDLKGKYEFFDLFGANTPDITYYKSTFGGDLIPYYTISKACSRRAQFLCSSRDYCKSLRGVLRRS